MNLDRQHLKNDETIEVIVHINVAGEIEKNLKQIFTKNILTI